MSEISLKINGQKFEHFNNFKVTLAYNSIGSVFSFDGLVLNENQKKLFKPLSYHDVQVYMGSDLILTGIALSTSTSVSNNISLGSISGYSKTGALEDCNIPVRLYPLQFDGMTLKEITEKLIDLFDLELVIDSTVTDKCNEKYTEITAKPTQTIKEFICEMAKQKNVIVSHDKFGRLLFTSLKLGTPSIATYIEDKPATKISVSVNGQGLHSEIYVQAQAGMNEFVPGEGTVLNAMVLKFRPLSKIQTTGDVKNIDNTAKMVRSSELRNISVTIDTDRWTWYDGKKTTIIVPNKIIEVQSPGNFIKKRSRLFVEQVEYSGNSEQQIATLKCVMPETYTGATPKNIFE